MLCCHRCEFSSQWQLQMEQTPFSSETFPAPRSFIWRSLGALQLTLHNYPVPAVCPAWTARDIKAQDTGRVQGNEGCAAGCSGLRAITTSARSKGLHGNEGKFAAERVKSRAVACRALCLRRSLPAPTKHEQMVHCFKGFSETKEQDQITFPQRGYLQKAFALLGILHCFPHNILFVILDFGVVEKPALFMCFCLPPPGTRRAS